MGELIKFTNKGFLREHPFDNPIDAPTPVQTHSYIFPADEIVLYHKLTLPGDAGVGGMNNIKFVSAKISLIAQKQNVFSEEFSMEFLAMRGFDLDSFTIAFNNNNARVRPWGSDGYAPDLNVRQDRNWQLPAGDFRRQVNFFTKHTASTSSWDYWFYFPVIFRWEYWISLLSADVDFFDMSQAQNGQNNWWYHYFTTKWKIKSRLELSILKNGQPAIIRSDRNLTPNAVVNQDVNDYSFNADWINKTIKTAKVGDTPSNTPCVIYGNRNTAVYGYFSKVSAWGANEQGNISAVLWIEPFQEAGITSRSRASSLYPITAESVFAGIDTSLTDDSGTGVTDDAGDFVITAPDGNGVLVWFDGINPEKVTFFGLIDYQKLIAAFPGVTKFTLYARLYDSTIQSSETIRGEEIKIDCILVNAPSSYDLCEKQEPECGFSLEVFADSGTDELKNDVSDFYQYGDNLISAITFILQKNSSDCGDGTWIDKATIADNTYGKFFAYGKANDFSNVDFTDDYAKKYTGMLLEWKKVKTAFGTGKYRMKILKADIFSVQTTSYDVREFCLFNYNCNVIDGSVRLEMLNQGLRGTLDNNVFIDYQNGWPGQIRLKGLFYADKKPSYAEEYSEYGDADFNALRPYIAEMKPKYLLDIKSVPGWLDRYLENYFLLSDSKWITDYNVVNINPFVKFPVINDGGIESMRETLALSERLASCRISLAYGQNNLRKRNS